MDEKEVLALIMQHRKPLSDLCHMMAQAFTAMGELIAAANQPLPEPRKAPLVGGPPWREHAHEVESCICETWEREPISPDPITDNDAAVLAFVARSGTVRATYLEEHIALPASEVARVVDSLVCRKLLDTFTDTPGNAWYRPFPDNAPASEKRHIDAPWIPDEPPQSEARPIVDEPARVPAVGSVEEPDGKMTARQWGTSKHFLEFMKQNTFKEWSAEEQNKRRDEFVEHVNETTPGKKMGRWGQQFKIFFKMKEKK